MGRNFLADLTARGFAAAARIKGKLYPHCSHFSLRLPLVADCFLTVLQILGGARSYSARGTPLLSSHFPWLRSTGMSLPGDILAEHGVF